MGRGDRPDRVDAIKLEGVQPTTADERRRVLLWLLWQRFEPTFPWDFGPTITVRGVVRAWLVDLLDEEAGN